MGAQLLFGATKVQLWVGAVGFSRVLSNIANTIRHWGNWILLLVGIVLITYGAISLFKAIKSLGGQQGPGGGGIEWIKAILAIVIGIVLAATKVSDIENNGQIDHNTVKDALNGNG